MMKRRIILLAVMCVAMIASVAAINIVERRIPSSGTVYTPTFGLEAFWDAGCTQLVSNIDWGVIEVGMSATRDFYLSNTGDTPLVLNMTAENWSPASAEGCIYLACDSTGAVLNAGEVRAVQLVLTVASDALGVTDFNVDVVIWGERG